jgi:hypothetical protein
MFLWQSRSGSAIGLSEAGDEKKSQIKAFTELFQGFSQYRSPNQRRILLPKGPRFSDPEEMLR